MKHNRKLLISIMSLMFLAVTFTSTTYAWFKLNGSASVGFDFKVTSGLGFQISIDNYNYKQTLTLDDIKLSYYHSLYPETYYVLDSSSNTTKLYQDKHQVSSDDIEKAFNQVALYPVTSSNGYKLTDLYQTEIKKERKRYLEFDVYFKTTNNEYSIVSVSEDEFNSNKSNYYIEATSFNKVNDVIDYSNYYEYDLNNGTYIKASADTKTFYEYVSPEFIKEDVYDYMKVYYTKEDILYNDLSYSIYTLCDNLTSFDSNTLYYTMNSYVSASNYSYDEDQIYYIKNESFNNQTYDIYLFTSDDNYGTDISSNVKNIEIKSKARDDIKNALARLDKSSRYNTTNNTISTYSSDASRLSITRTNICSSYITSNNYLDKLYTAKIYELSKETNLGTYASSANYLDNISYLYYNSLRPNSNLSNYLTNFIIPTTYNIDDIKATKVSSNGRTLYEVSSTNPKLTTVNSSSLKTKLTIRFWIDGWDADCFDGLSESINVRLAFTGIKRSS